MSPELREKRRVQMREIRRKQLEALNLKKSQINLGTARENSDCEICKSWRSNSGQDTRADLEQGGTGGASPKLGSDASRSGSEAEALCMRSGLGNGRDNGAACGSSGADTIEVFSPGEGSGTCQQSLPDSAPAGEDVDSEQLYKLYDPSTYITAHRAGDKALAEWQIDFVRDCQVVKVIDNVPTVDTSIYPRNIALLAVNGSGKTELIGELLFYFLETIPGCVIPITSSVYRQLEMLESYLRSNVHKHVGFEVKEGRLTHGSGNFARWFATDSEGSVESFHGPFLIRILDEVKSMADGIVDATNRWQPKLSIFVSSKGVALGRLYEVATVNRVNWSIHEVDAFMCPWISRQWIEQQVGEHGRNSGLIKSMIYNEWDDADCRNLIGMDAINKCVQNPPFLKGGSEIVAGIDLSAAKKGGDECVVYHRKGNQVQPPFIVNGCTTEMEVVGVVIRHLREIGAQHVFADAGGLGGPMISRMAEVLGENDKIELHRENFGGNAKCNDLGAYDRGTEIWSYMSRKIERREIAMPNDARTIGQIATREVKPMSDGTVKLVSKDESVKKFGKSPDRADALALCLCEPMGQMRTITWAREREQQGDVYEARTGNEPRYYVTSDGIDLGG